MKFKTASIEAAFRSPMTHPDLRLALVETDHWIQASRLPEMVLSDGWRTKKSLTKTYVKIYSDLREKARIGHVETLSLEDQEMAKRVRHASDAEMLAMAKERFSWHCYGCGFDISGNNYSVTQRALVNGHLKAKYTKPKWEYMLHGGIGDAPHFHLARRDASWRSRFDFSEGGNIA